MNSAVKRLRDIESVWMAKATQAAIDAARDVITQNDINGRAMISSLNNLEWGWIACAAVFAWIRTKSEQATAEGFGYDEAIRAMPGQKPQAWDAGAVASILPALGGLHDIDWNKPIGEWSKDQVISFAWHAHGLVNQALAARDEGATDKLTQNTSQVNAERELSAWNGGPLLARGELDECEIPF